MKNFWKFAHEYPFIVFILFLVLISAIVRIATGTDF